MNTIMTDRTKLKILLILTPLLGITLIVMGLALPNNRQLGSWIFLCSFLLVLFICSIIIRLYGFRDGNVTLKEFIATRPLFVKYLMLDRRRVKKENISIIAHSPSL